MQAATLIELLASQRPNELAEAFAIAWQEGPRWRDKIDYGMARLPVRSQETLKTLIQRWRSTRRGKREAWKDPPGWLNAT